MNWRIKKYRDDTQWHRHFAWLPVATYDRKFRCWLEPVDRRYVGGQDGNWEYRIWPGR